MKSTLHMLNVNFSVIVVFAIVLVPAVHNAEAEEKRHDTLTVQASTPEKPGKQLFDKNNSIENGIVDEKSPRTTSEKETLNRVKPDQEAIPPFLQAEFVELFDQGQFSADAEDGQRKIEYRIFKPNILPNKKYPLIVWLHGGGEDERKFRNLGQLKHVNTTIFRKLGSRDEYPFFVLVPQMPNWAINSNSKQETPLHTIDSETHSVSSDANGAKDRSAHDGKGTEMTVPTRYLGEIIDQLLGQYPIDPDRVCLIGISAGATEAWKVARDNPERYAVLVSLASYLEDLEGLEKLSKTSIWSFHSEGDNPEKAKTLISRLNKAGGWGYFTQTSGKFHDCWYDAFGEEYELLPWILNQERGVRKYQWQNNKEFQWWTWKEYKDFFINYWPQWVWVIIFVICVIAIRKESRRKRIARLSESVNALL